MFYVERLDVASGEPFIWEPIESSWEFKNPTQSRLYACKIAKNLALRSDGDSQFRVIRAENSSIIANYFVVKQLLVQTIDGISVEAIAPGIEVPMVSEIQ